MIKIIIVDIHIQNISENPNWTNRKGGLKLCHFETKVKVLKISSVKRLASEKESTWKTMPKNKQWFSGIYSREEGPAPPPFIPNKG